MSVYYRFNCSLNGNTRYTDKYNTDKASKYNFTVLTRTVLDVSYNAGTLLGKWRNEESVVYVKHFFKLDKDLYLPVQMCKKQANLELKC